MDLIIGIVNYKSGDYLERCLDCIFSCTQGITYKVIVVDNSSEDGSAETLSKDRRISKLILNNKNVGYSSACNQIVSASKGKYLLFLNPDVKFASNVIGGMVHFMEKHPEAMGSGCKILFPDGSIQGSCGYFPGKRVILLRSVALDKVLKRIPVFKKRYDFDYCAYPDKVSEVDWILGAFFLIRRDVFDRIRYFDRDYFLYGEEIDLCFRLHQGNFKILYNPEYEITHFMGSSTRRHPIKSIYHFHRAMYLLHKKSWMPKMSMHENVIVINGIFWKMVVAYGRHFLGVREAHEMYAHRAK